MPAAIPRRRRSLADVALAPLTWLERARGRWRLALATLYLLILAVVAVLTWRAFSLWDLPDIGEPFDVAAFTTCDVSDDQNAFAFYARAAAMLRPLRDPSGKEVALQDAGYDTTGYVKTWARAGPRARMWHELNREALEIWRQGTQRDHAWPRAGPDGPDMERGQELESLRFLTTMGLAEASRLREAGDLAGAWGWYRAALRASRHATARGFITWVGSQLWEWVAPDVRDWATLPGVDRPLLRHALDDVIAAAALSKDEDIDIIKQHYVTLMKELDRSRANWLDERLADESNPYRLLVHEPELRWFLRREPERTRRLVRIAVANWLAHRALDPDAPLDLDFPPLAFWALGPEAPAAARALSVAEAEAWCDSSLVLRGLSNRSINQVERELNAIHRPRAELILFLARRLYQLDHGRPPAVDRDLVGPYLDRLPAGYNDLSAPAAESNSK